MVQAFAVLLSVLQATLPIAVCFPHGGGPASAVLASEHSHEDCHPSPEDDGACCTDRSQDLAPPAIGSALEPPHLPAPSPLPPDTRPALLVECSAVPGPIPRTLLELASCLLLR
ncbi:MAG: hypothetical protein ACT4PV_08370 [Planctomycetaceae bacterium]